MRSSLRKARLGWGLFILASQGGSGQEAAKVASRFDCGTATSPLKTGWTPVTHETVFTSERGYGWEQACESAAFDRTGSFQPDWLKGPPVAKPPLDDVLRDGVADKKDITFKVALPDGDYGAVVSVRDEGATRENMSVLANGEPMTSPVSTRTSWGGYPTTRLLRQRERVSGEGLRLTFRHQGQSNSVLGVAILPFAPSSTTSANNRDLDSRALALGCAAAITRRNTRQARRCGCSLNRVNGSTGQWIHGTDSLTR